MAEPDGVGAAVLIRALRPVAGVARMHERRQLPGLRDLCSGPGKLTQALGIGLEHNGTDLARGPVRIHPPPAGQRVALATGTRIGITRAVELPWRFCVADSRFVSRPRPRTPVRGAA